MEVLLSHIVQTLNSSHGKKKKKKKKKVARWDWPGEIANCLEYVVEQHSCAVLDLGAIDRG